jgi:hypothetical protein
MDSFKLDDAVHLQPVVAGAITDTRPGDDGMTDTVVIVKADKACKQVLLNEFADSRLPVVTLDQGGIGVAGMAFAINSKGLMVSVKFDKYYRITRVIKLSFKDCCGGVFLNTQFYSSYLHGLNYKPFNSGGLSQVKARLPQVFMASEGIHSEIWLKYCDRIAADL